VRKVVTHPGLCCLCCLCCPSLTCALSDFALFVSWPCKVFVVGSATRTTVESVVLLTKLCSLWGRGYRYHVCMEPSRTSLASPLFAVVRSCSVLGWRFWISRCPLSATIHLENFLCGVAFRLCGMNGVLDQLPRHTWIAGRVSSLGLAAFALVHRNQFGFPAIPLRTLRVSD
jgi:hypothetical protein